MAYNVAVASTDGINIDKHFGQTETFFIIKVNDDGTYENIGERVAIEASNEDVSKNCGGDSKEASKSCGSSSCGGGGGHSCGHSDPKIQKKIDTISDCRCLLCSQCGPGSEKQLGKSNIATFAVDLKLDEALNTIIKYYKKVDAKESLRDIRSK